MITNTPGTGRTILVQRSMRARRSGGVSKPWPGPSLVQGTFSHPTTTSFGVWGLKSGQLVEYIWAYPTDASAWFLWFASLFPAGPRSYQDGLGGYYFNQTMRAQFQRMNI